MAELPDDPSRRGSRGPDPFGLGRRVLGAAGELNLLRILPEVLLNLREIRDFVAVVAREITAINASVGKIDPAVSRLVDRVEAIEIRTEGIEVGIARLERQMAELDDALHPLRRTRSRRSDPA